MTREHKLALIVGFALVLVLGVLISDHFSKARQVEMAGASEIKMPTPSQMGASGAGRAIPDGVGNQPVQAAHANGASGRTDLVTLPGVAMPLPQDPPPARGVQLVMGGNAPAPLVETGRGGQYPAPYGDHHDDGAVNVPQQQVPVVAQIPLTRYDVKEGDTLYRIASKVYGDAKLWEKVRDYNKDKVGSGNSVREGVTLLLPPKDVLLGKPYVPPVSTVQTPLGGQPTIAPKPAGDFKEYTVREGDTLVAIARKQLNSGKRFNEIIEANKGTLADPESLSVGMKLRIPAK